MVRVLLLSIITTATIAMGGFGFGLASASTEELKQTCRNDKGEFSVLKGDQSELSICFFGETAIGAEALAKLKNEGVQADSVRAYKNRKTSSPRGGVCGAFDADLVTAKDSAGQSYNLCRFADNSVMEETTLWLGPGGTTDGDGLDKVLSKIR